MRVENLRLEKIDTRARATATVVWEDCDRATHDVYFETEAEFARGLSCNPNAFLVACAIPAMRFGEKRISIEAEICPELHNGLITAVNILRHWYPWYDQKSALIKIEAKASHYLPSLNKTKRAGFLFSGGVDSLATLRDNRLNYSQEHPGFIRDGVLVCGLEVRDPDSFEFVLDSVRVLAEDAGVTLIPVHTNVIELGPENFHDFWGDFWINEYMGAVFAAIGHALSNRLMVLSINSCHDVPNLMPYGSHPLLNPNYSSSELRIRHQGIALSRFAKTRLISDWDVALQHLRVCNHFKSYQKGILNCGKCEKCVRTMLALLASRSLEKASAFPTREVTAELIGAAVQLAPNTIPLYIELIPPLKEIGRSDLVHAIERKMVDLHKSQKREKWRSRTIEPVKEFDRKYLNCNIRKLKAMLSG
jgi:hypothetical protein